NMSKNEPHILTASLVSQGCLSRHRRWMIPAPISNQSELGFTTDSGNDSGLNHNDKQSPLLPITAPQFCINSTASPSAKGFPIHTQPDRRFICTGWVSSNIL